MTSQTVQSLLHTAGHGKQKLSRVGSLAILTVFLSLECCTTILHQGLSGDLMEFTLHNSAFPEDGIEAHNFLIIFNQRGKYV
jgi:hypothetical protein